MLEYLLVPILGYCAYEDLKHYSIPAWAVYVLTLIVLYFHNPFALIILAHWVIQKIFHKYFPEVKPLPYADSLGLALLFTFLPFDIAMVSLIFTIIATYICKKLPYYVFVCAILTSWWGILHAL